MPQLTERQRNLLRLINQLAQTGTNSVGQNSGFSIDFPQVDLDLGIDLGGITIPSTPTPPTPPTPPGTPTTMRELLLSLVNEQVELTTPFGAVTGTLLAVRDDYVVLIEADGSQVLVRIDKVELVGEL